MRALTFVLALAVALPACKRSPSAVQVDPAPSVGAPSAKVAEILDGLASPDEARSRAADKSLRELAKTLRPRDGVALIRGAARTFPRSKLALMSPQAGIFYAIDDAPDPSFVDPVREVFSQLDPTAKTAALQLLSFVDTPEAARAFVELVAQAVAQSPDLEIRAAGFEKNLPYAGILFPALLDSARGTAADGIARLSLAFAQGRAVQGADLAPHLGSMLVEYRKLHDQLVPLQRGPDAGPSWVEDDAYASARETAEVMLDLFGWTPSDDTLAALRQALDLRDPRLVAFAAGSLVRRGAAVSAAALELAAADADARGPLFDALAGMKRADLFPARWATQAALAESVMVRWLEYPTELGGAPSAIELMKVVSEDMGGDDRLMDWYLFRFRADDEDWSDKGWMAGVAGPFKRAEEPSTRDYGDTFSSFDAWASMPPQQHVAKLKGIIAKWAASRAAGGAATP